MRRMRQYVLDRFVLPRLDNEAGNRRLWDTYARDWRQHDAYLDVDLVGAEAAAWRAEHVTFVGDEWGTPDDVERVLGDFVYPNLRDDLVVAEIGIGGGRIASVGGRRRQPLRAHPGLRVGRTALTSANQGPGTFRVPGP